ncbi:uncharacterized protein [Amphiura filiformis]|uniref:uncharacterized protein n=1 Tax=Amphiura filiformis TaxID=82378 RepID=UPI003B224BCE
MKATTAKSTIRSVKGRSRRNSTSAKSTFKPVKGRSRFNSTSPRILRRLRADSDVESAGTEEKPAVEEIEVKKRKKSKGTRRFLTSKSKRQKSSSSQQETESNKSEESLASTGDLNIVIMTDKENPVITQDGDDDIEIKGEEVKDQNDEEDNKMAATDNSQDGANVENVKTGRTGASKSEGEAADDDEDVDFPEGVVVEQPTSKSHTLPASSSPVVTPTTPTSPTSADKKKKRFQPFKSIRKLFRKRKDDDDNLPPSIQQLSKSTGHLDRTEPEEGNMDRSKSVSPALLGRPMSMSEDSVFSPDPSDDQRPVTPANKDFANELASKLQNRQTTPLQKTEKKEDALNESNTRDSGVSLSEEHYVQNSRKPKTKTKPVKRPWKSFSPSTSASAVAAKQKITQKKLAATTDTLGDLGDFDSIAAPSNLLVSNAAKHRISIKPQRSRRPPSRLRPISSPQDDMDTSQKTKTISPLAAPPPATALTPPSLKVPKGTKPVDRSDSDRKVKRTSSDAKNKTVEESKPIKEKVLPPPVIKRKDNKEDDSKLVSSKVLPDVQEDNENKKEPLVNKSSKEKVLAPPEVQKRKDKEPIVSDSKPETIKDSLPKDSENKDLKPKTVIKGKSPVKVPVVEPKSSSDKVVTVIRSGSKSESDIKDKQPSKADNVIVKDEEKENKAPSPVPTDKLTDKKPVATKKEESIVPSAGAGRTVSESEPASVKPSIFASQDKTVEKETSKASSEEKKRPVTPPKPRKEMKIPANSDDKSDDEAPAKPLSLKERMALLNSAASKNGANSDSKPAWKKTPKQGPSKTATK